MCQAWLVGFCITKKGVVLLKHVMWIFKSEAAGTGHGSMLVEPSWFNSCVSLDSLGDINLCLYYLLNSTSEAQWRTGVDLLLI